jgi:hypothetical protein
VCSVGAARFPCPRGGVGLAAYAEGVSLREANRKLGCLTEAEFDRLLRPEAMTHPSRRPVDASPKF